MVALWVPFAKLLLDNVETVRDAAGFLGKDHPSLW